MNLKSLAGLASLLTVSPTTALAQTYTGIQDAIPQSAESLADRTGENWVAGNTKYDGWYNLSTAPQTKTVDGTSHDFPALSGYPTTFTSSNAYANPIASQLSTTGLSKAALTKVANGNGSGGLDKFHANGTRNATTWGGSGFGPYPAGASIYAISFSNVYNAKGGTFGVFEANPVINLASVVFQVEIGSANGYDFYESDVVSNAGTAFGSVASRTIGGLDPLLGREPGGPVIFPTLNLTFANSSTLAIAANYAELLTQGFNGTIAMPTGPNGEDVEEPIYINLYGFQWDLTEYTDITSFTVTFDVVEHTQFYSAQLDQSDTFTQIIASPVPEPSATLLAGLLGITSLLRRRR